MTKQRWDNYEDHVKEFGLIPLTDNQIQRILDVEMEHFQVRMPKFSIVPFIENDPVLPGVRAAYVFGESSMDDPDLIEFFGRPTIDIVYHELMHHVLYVHCGV